MKPARMFGAKAYANYCEACNNCAPEDLLRFSGEREYLEHASRLMEKQKIMINHTEFFRFLFNVAGVEGAECKLEAEEKEYFGKNFREIVKLLFFQIGCTTAQKKADHESRTY